MFRLRHPFSGHIYTALDDGLVAVEKNGKRGVFDRYGFWLEGEIRMADTEMCRWVGTHNGAPPTRHRAGFDQADNRTAAHDRTPVSKESS